MPTAQAKPRKAPEPAPDRARGEVRPKRERRTAPQSERTLRTAHHGEAAPEPAGEPLVRRRVTLRALAQGFPFLGVHAASLLAFWVPFSWSLVALCIGLYLVRMFGLTAGYHRYFSHRTYRTSRAFQFVLALLGASSMQKGPLWWAAHHRHHHLHSDDDLDLHSPGRQGFWWSHLGWVLSKDHDETNLAAVPDLARYPELRWLDRYFAVPGVTLAVVLFLAGGLPALVWGYFVSTVLTWQITFSINSLTHMIGRRRYATTDDSRNSLILALLTLGEGWHNNHHHYQASTRQGFFWWEIDLSYYALRLLAAVGLVWDLREPPKKVLESNRLRAA